MSNLSKAQKVIERLSPSELEEIGKAAVYLHMGVTPDDVFDDMLRDTTGEDRQDAFDGTF